LNPSSLLALSFHVRSTLEEELAVATRALGAAGTADAGAAPDEVVAVAVLL
jgi:hypothetical protein